MATKSANSVVKPRWPKPLKAVSANDGHVYYLIGDDGDEGVANVTFVDFYSSLNQFAPKAASAPWNDPDGFFFVRDAASSGPDHYGDPTVHAGWAMYIWDGTKYKPESSNSGWIKISQQGDTDWDITDELKAMFVLKTVYNVKMNEIDKHFQRVEGSIIQIGSRVKTLEVKMDKIYPMAHVHVNKEVLDQLSEPYLNVLYYKGRPIGGNSYIYNHVEDVDGTKEITWCDPTLTEDKWTHEVVDNSEAIANKFTETDLARLGLTLIVVEADGSLSLFKYINNPDGEGIVPKFAQTIVRDNLGLAEYVIMLPPAAKQYVGRGCWVPVQDDGVHTVNHLHKCIKVTDDVETGAHHYEWTDVTNNGSQLGVKGSEIDICFSENYTMWTRNHLHFTIPADTTKEGNIPVRWAKTVIVRKFGSAPENANDGTVVLTLTDKSKYATECFIDTVPYISHLKNDEPMYWYYRAFSTTMSGDTYSATDAVVAKKLDWKMIYSILHGDNADIVFHVGDEIYLPHHAEYGDILCEIVGVNTTVFGSEEPGLLVVTKNVLCEKEIDAAEPASASGSSNPEWIGEAHGSNGSLLNNVHNLTTLNIINWLNSTEQTVTYKKTAFDQTPSYGTEAGFMSGFDVDDRAVFGYHPSFATGNEQIDAVKVCLPRSEMRSWDNITKTKTIGNSTTPTVWASMTGVDSAASNRPKFKFKLSDGNDVLPEETTGIVPMFFLVGIDPEA